MTTTDERTPLDPTISEIHRLIDSIGERLDTIAAALDSIGRPPVTMLAPAYHPERMGYLSEVRVGDRVLFAGGWRQVATSSQGPSGTVRMTFTDPDMDALVDKGTHAIRIQKRADEQQADALHRRDTGGL